MKNRIVYLLVRLLTVVCQRIHAKGQRVVAGVLSWTMIRASKKRFEVTRDNIRHAFPNTSSKRVDEIARASYNNFALCYVELLSSVHSSEQFVAERFRFENPEVLTQQASTGRGCIIISAHLGNWELAVQATAFRFHRYILSVAKPQRNTQLDSFLNACRTTKYNSIVSMHSAARDMVSTLKSGNMLGLLIDQAADPLRDVFVQFLGRPAVTFDAPASLALRYNADIVAAFCIRESDGNYCIKTKVIEHRDLERTKAGTEILVQRCSKALEDVIREYPEQWSWQHRRWKYNPEDYKNT